MSTQSPQKLHRILLVEDNPGDADLLIEAFSRLKGRFEVATTIDGEDAISYLRRESPHQAAVAPDMIILDLNLPKMDGREVLQVLKNDPLLRRIPVIVFSSSSAERDLVEVYQLHGNCFMTKPVELNEYFQLAADLEHFWFAAAKLPPRAF